MKPRVAIIYLAYGMQKYLEEVVEGLEKTDYPKESLRIYFIPNGSPDGISEAIQNDVLPRSGKDLPECVLMDDGVNRGFAGGNNQAIQQAIDEGFEYVFLHNGDLKLDVNTISRLVEEMEKNELIGSAQPLVMYWKEPEKVNVSGGLVHIAGYGYGRHNGTLLKDVNYAPVEEVFYASGAAVLYRSSVLQKVGLLEEGFFMYHEDLELGWRIRMAGYVNVLVSDVQVFHDYGFSRNPKKFAWTELYRWIVVLAYYRLVTLLLLMPLLLVIEVGTWFMALRGGWLKAKFWALQEWFYPRTWKLLFSMRKRSQELRTISDKEILERIVGKIEAQEQSNWIVDRVANPMIKKIVTLYKWMIIW